MNIIFDLGGVVVRWDPDFIVKSFTDDPGLQTSILDGIFRHPDWIALDRGTMEREEAIPRAAGRTGLREDTIVAVFEHAVSTMTPFAGTLELIERVRARGHRLLCLSNMHRASMEHLDRVHGISDLFYGAIISCRVKAVKPDRRIFEILVSSYDLRPDESVFVDDTKVNTDAAALLGFRTVHFLSPEQCTREIRSMGVI